MEYTKYCNPMSLKPRNLWERKCCNFLAKFNILPEYYNLPFFYLWMHTRYTAKVISFVTITAFAPLGVAVERKTWHIGISYREEPGVFVSAWFCFGKQEPFFVMVGLSLTRLFMIIMMSLINDHVRQRMMMKMTRMMWSTGKKSSAWWWSSVLPNFLWCALWITLWSRWRHLWWWRWCWSWWNRFVYFQLSFLKLSATEWRWHGQELWVIVEGILCTASHLFTEHSSISIFNFPLVFATWTARKCKRIKLFAFARVLQAVAGNFYS